MKNNISVVMATYNGGKYIKQQLDSIARQADPPHELVISDDNSTDETYNIVKEFAGRAPFPVRVLRNVPGLGFRDNFLRAASTATGEWIAFCDQDDIWNRDKLRRCAAFTVQADVMLIVHQANLIDTEGVFIATFKQGIENTCVRSPLFYDVWGTFWGFSMIVRRSVLGAVPDEMRYVDYVDPGFRISHDRWAFFLAQTLGRTVEIAEPLVDYRQHASNLFGAGKGRTLEGIEVPHVVRERHRPYVAATRQMLEIIRNIPRSAEVEFPAFNRTRAERVYERALRQVEMREAIYAGSSYASVALCLRALCNGAYRNAHNNSFRWRSFLKDMFYSIKR